MILMSRINSKYNHEFFSNFKKESIAVINNAKEHLKDSTDLYQFCKEINNKFNYQKN